MKSFQSLFLILFFIAGHVQANIWHSGKIDLVYPNVDYQVVLGFTEDHPDCENQSGFYHIQVGKNGITEKMLEMLFSGAMAAAAQGIEVAIRFNPEDNKCYIDRMQMKY